MIYAIKFIPISPFVPLYPVTPFFSSIFPT